MSRHEHSVLVRVRVTAGQPAGSVFVPMHFSAAYASRAELNALIPAITDPISGQPAGKRCRSFAYLLIASGLLLVTTFDSQSLLCVVLAGDARLLDKLRREELIPLGSRIRTRLATGVATRDELLACLDHLLTTAGNASLMTQELRHTLCDHAAGHYRICIAMAAELLMTAAQRDITILDEKLYLQVFSQPQPQGARRAASAR